METFNPPLADPPQPYYAAFLRSNGYSFLPVEPATAARTAPYAGWTATHAAPLSCGYRCHPSIADDELARAGIVSLQSGIPAVSTMRSRSLEVLV
jgi:hypothetical protein